jgi:hypothetical protein
MAERVKKEKSEHNAVFAKGGNTHMFGEQEAGKAKSGTTGKPDESGPGAKFAVGGSSKMFGFAGSQPARAGQTGAR